MKNIWTIMKKELTRVFKDMRLVTMVFLLPGLMIYGIYTLMGNGLTSVGEEGKNETAEIYVVNRSQKFDAIFELIDPDNNEKLIELNANFNPLEMSELESKKALLKTEDSGVDYIIIFEEAFDELLDKTVPDYRAPTMEVFYNPSLNLSAMIHEKIIMASEILKTYVLTNNNMPSQVITIAQTTIYDEKKATGQMFAMMLPFLIVSFLFSGAMAVGPESIAGEKERGTMATLLITPTKRSQIALGKILSLSILSVISAISSFIGVFLSLPKIMGNGAADTSIYGVAEYGGILLVMISTVFLLISIISVISAFAKNIKEASMYVMPVMILSMLVGITSMFSTSVPNDTVLYAIPIYNAVQTMSGIFSFEFNATHLLVTIAANLVFTVALGYVLTKMFNSEKMMFSK